LSKKGISFVLQGPPGTGKSQTITNIIAEAISDGKKVLFVSEKMAALEVVKKRLSEAGLADFCLTLHSYKANKKDVLSQLGKTLNIQKISLRDDAIYKLSVLEDKRNKLNEYQEQLHEKCEPLNISIYEANGRLAKLSSTQDIIFGISNIENADVELLNRNRYLLSEFSKTIGKLSEDYSENPWYGCNVPAVTHELRHDIEVNLNKLSLELKNLNQTIKYVIEKTGANIAPSFKNVSLLSELLDLSSKSPLFPIKWLSEDIAVLTSDAQKYLKLFNEYKENTTGLLNQYEEDILKLNANDIISTIESNMTDMKMYLDNSSYPSNKDIVLKSDFIIRECREIKAFMQKIYSQSKELSSILDMGKNHSINSILEVGKLVELILKKPQPLEIWFKHGGVQSVTELLQIAKNEQVLLNDNLNKISVNFNGSILDIEFDEILARFKNHYIQLLNIISMFNNSSNILELNQEKISSFAYDQAEKLRAHYLSTTNALEVSTRLTESIGIKSVQTLNGLVSLDEFLSAIIQNPKPTLAWFDENKEFVIDKIISDIKSIQNEIGRETDELLTKYNKDILSIDYKNMLIRFKTEYSNFFKFLKGSYGADKKTIRGFIKESNNKLADSEIIAILQKITLIKEKEEWLIANKSLATEMLGDLYMDNYTDWEIVKKCRENFKIIKKFTGVNTIPEKLKRILLERDIENLMSEQGIVSKVVESNVLDYVESIYGADVGKRSISELLIDMQYTTDTSIKIMNDIENILKHAINTVEIGEIKLKDIIDILTSIKEIGLKRKWFSDNDNKLLDSFGMHFKSEYTDWDNVKDRIDTVEQIIEYFNGRHVPLKLIDYLISCDYSQDNFEVYCSDIDEISKKNIVMRLNSMLNNKDNQIIDIDKLICILEEIENGVNISHSKYVDFSGCSKGSARQFETVMADIIMLNRIQEIEVIVENHLSELQLKFEFMIKGMNTNWDKVLSSLDYANKFNSLRKDYSLSNEYVSGVCSDRSITEWAIKHNEILKEQALEVNVHFDWFVSIFDNGDELYNTSIYTILDRIQRSIENLSLLEEWIDFRSIRQQCREIGLSEFVDKVEQMAMKPEIIVDTYFKRFYRLWLDIMMPRYPAVYSFRSRSHQSIINDFNNLDKSQLDIARLRILERLISRLPNTNIATSSVDEVGILKRELTKQRKIMPLRRLFKAVPNLLTALKPCLMMSPLSVSLFLQADGYSFDTVIFDEASQVCTEDAIGAIMRGKQVIIAGDSKQLPPTSFFAATLSDGDFDSDSDSDDDVYDDTGAYDSILEEAVNAIPERTLKWHYRSRHENLIAFSNAKIYNHELITFPSNMDNISDNGVEYVYVEDGVYDRGGKKHNLNEAKRVAVIVFEHIRKYPNRSLGVVTFSEAQQQAVDSAIRQLRLHNSQYEKFFSEDTEHAFFIKNLENVQGDERDTIIFSIGYAKDSNGVMYMNFGPLSRNGGQRRLNVAITRAKYNVKLVGSLHPTDIKVENTNSEGVKMLRQYIEYAINGVSVLQNELRFSNTVNVDSPFEEAVHDFLIKNGYNVTTQVGCSGYRIDMAVKHPTLSGIFVLGVECDGATYHSARTARERDRLRQTVLEDIGWTIYRIWSTDWIKDPNTEGHKLLEAVNIAISNYKMGSFSTGSISNDETASNDTSLAKQAYVTIETTNVESEAENNNPYNFTYYKETDVYEIERISNDTDYLSNVINFVVEEEMPIHFELLCKRVATLFGNQKATVKVRDSVEYVLNNNLNDLVLRKGDFCWHINAKGIKVKIPQMYGDGRAINYN
jgi:very-short-patch-repair endonuclease